MTLEEAVREMRALYPGAYVTVSVSACWSCADERPGISVSLYADTCGHVVWNASSIALAIAELRLKHEAASEKDLALNDADLEHMKGGTDEDSTN